MKYFFCILLIIPMLYCLNTVPNKKLFTPYARDQAIERLLESLQKKTDDYQTNRRDDKINGYFLRKRNNAELVNHILKNMNEVDILGEIG